MVRKIYWEADGAAGQSQHLPRFWHAVKLSTKSSSAAKLFNAVHKAQVSWNRIRPLLDSVNEEEDGKEWRPGDLEVKDVSFAYPDGKRVLEHVSFSAKPGQIIGVTGPVACGKSTLGKFIFM